MRPAGFIGNHNPVKVRNRLACTRRVTLITTIQRILANADSIVTISERRHVRNALCQKLRKGNVPCPASRGTARLMTNGPTYANLRERRWLMMTASPVSQSQNQSHVG